MWDWIKHFFKESLNQSWTLLGMFIAWCVLEGSAKIVVGDAILLTTAVWLLFTKLTEEGDNDHEDL